MHRVFASIMSCALLCSCDREPTPTNRQQPLTSPSGSHVLTVPIGRHPKYADTPAWIVTIKDKAGVTEYQDADTNFIGTLNVYWCWDNGDRVWLYNSDDGRIWYWELSDGKWTKQQYEPDKSPSHPRPPSEVYPPYAKNRD